MTNVFLTEDVTHSLKELYELQDCKEELENLNTNLRVSNLIEILKLGYPDFVPYKERLLWEIEEYL